MEVESDQPYLHLLTSYGIAVSTVVNAVFAFVPRDWTIATQTAAIKATMRAYSTSVAPSSSFKTALMLLSNTNTSFLLFLHPVKPGRNGIL